MCKYPSKSYLIRFPQGVGGLKIGVVLDYCSIELIAFIAAWLLQFNIIFLPYILLS